jgi:hypothetical protein
VAQSAPVQPLAADREGVTARLERRTKILLRGVQGTRRYQQAVHDVYASRSEIVHGGTRSTQPDMHAAREAYVRSFAELAGRLPKLNRKSGTPLSDLIGDNR